MELLKGLSPAAIDSEFRNMAPDAGGSVEWLEYLASDPPDIKLGQTNRQKFIRTLRCIKFEFSQGTPLQYTCQC